MKARMSFGSKVANWMYCSKYMSGLKTI